MVSLYNDNTANLKHHIFDRLFSTFLKTFLPLSPNVQPRQAYFSKTQQQGYKLKNYPTTVTKSFMITGKLIKLKFKPL